MKERDYIVKEVRDAMMQAGQEKMLECLQGKNFEPAVKSAMVTAIGITILTRLARNVAEYECVPYKEFIVIIIDVMTKFELS